MDVELWKDTLSTESIQHIFETYREWIPFFSMGLPFLEAFLPFLPLLAFVMVNAAVHGLFIGFLYSWIGSCTGAMLLFLLIRHFGQHQFFAFVHRHPKMQAAMHTMKRKGFAPMFIFYCIPFSPSALLTVVAGLSIISKKQFLLALLLGKAVMIFGMSVIGNDWEAFFQKPFKALLFLAIIGILWLAGKRIEAKMVVEE
ncbi:TVP38/TMEM64 family protein [Ectobacillus polymachus]|uniref:TVP38/TMEM64 family protein n=1 Tax=Ectobacillus polymachus TaxID=1508806 RepID=UPI003A8BF4D1